MSGELAYCASTAVAQEGYSTDETCRVIEDSLGHGRESLGGDRRGFELVRSEEGWKKESEEEREAKYGERTET
ncbi:hypothetical protein TIFTF001_009900 [Ficus carica]|uniref:Uncharacterized protein n=1 Tax=Ficus carica TaxID=3494 RepID=A0AA87ZUH9_FICCA|nr:hypothetical protein TIFTF001_009900 [Ficus carica]